MLSAQKLKIVRRKIYYKQLAARPQNTGRFRYRTIGCVHIVQHLMDDHEISAVRFKRHGGDIALTHSRAINTQTLEVGARDRQHVMAEINAFGALGARREEAEHSSGTGSKVQHAPEGPLPASSRSADSIRSFG